MHKNCSAFPKLDTLLAENQRDDVLEEEMQRYWTRFALNGNPNEANLPYWPIFDPTSAKEMAFANEGSYARNVLRKARYDAMREQQSRRESAARSSLEAIAPP